MKEMSGKEMVALSASLAIELSECADIEELCALIEFLGLLRYDLDIIKCRKITLEKDKKKH